MAHSCKDCTKYPWDKGFSPDCLPLVPCKGMEETGKAHKWTEASRDEVNTMPCWKGEVAADQAA